jgi:acetyl-CoA carboxylase carboxyltransferase component
MAWRCHGELAFVGMTWQPELDELRRRQELAERMGGPDKIRRQHDAGRLTVRERIAVLLDEGSFREIGALAGTAAYDDAGILASFMAANFVTGTGRVAGRKVVVGGDDFTIRGGAADAGIIAKQIYSEQLANELRLPVIRLVEGTGGGGSVKSLEQTGHTYVPVNPGWDRVVDNLSVVPVVAAGLGPVAGLGAARLCAAHLSILVEGTAQLFVAGPPVVKSGAGEDVDKETLGGTRVHARNGAVDLVAASEAEAFELIRNFLSYLPPSAYALPPVIPGADPVDRQDESLLSAVPRDRRQPYRIRDILRAVFDAGGHGDPALWRIDRHRAGAPGRSSGRDRRL